MGIEKVHNVTFLKSNLVRQYIRYLLLLPSSVARNNYIYFLTVSAGQDSRHSSAGSFPQGLPWAAIQVQAVPTESKSQLEKNPPYDHSHDYWQDTIHHGFGLRVSVL